MTFRLPWERSDKPSTFVAYPRGRDRPNYVATVLKHPHRPHHAWGWSVSAGKARAAGTAETKQEAADAATVAWPQVIEEAQKVSGEETRLALLKATLGDIDRTGATVNLEGFKLGARSYAELLEMIRECRDLWVKHFHAGTTTPGIESLMAALSAELFTRRTQGKAPGWNR